MVGLYGFTPLVCVVLPLLSVDQSRRCKPDIPSQHIAILQHIAGSNVEDIQDELVEPIDFLEACRLDRADLYAQMSHAPRDSFVLGEIRNWKVRARAFLQWEDGFVRAARLVGGRQHLHRLDD